MPGLRNTFDRNAQVIDLCHFAFPRESSLPRTRVPHISRSLRDVGSKRIRTFLAGEPKGPNRAVVYFPHLAKNARYPDFLYAAPASAAYATFIKESRTK
jgi:hypothetical protein